MPESLYFEGREGQESKIEISYVSEGDGPSILVADGSTNGISKIFDVAVIKSGLRPHASSKAGFIPGARPTASLIIEPVVLVARIPTKPTRTQTASKLKTDFGKNGKILPSVDAVLDNHQIISRILQLPILTELHKKAFWKPLNVIREEINRMEGTTDEVLTQVSQRFVAPTELKPFIDAIQLQGGGGVDHFLMAYQLAVMCREDMKFVKAHCAWREYHDRKRKCTELLGIVNSNPAWISVSIKETKGELIASFPSAGNVSNGQRDLLSLVAQLMKSTFELKGSRAIVIIDDIFDYLDEVNLMVAQYFCSQFIDAFKERGDEVFLMVLTHLDPYVFGHSILGMGRKDLRKIHYLEKADDTSRTVGIAPMVRKRDIDALRPFIGKFYFHYHPAECDQEALFRAHSLKESWGKSHSFYRYTWEELRKFKDGTAGGIDYIAVCLGIRLAIEKCAFDQLSIEQRVAFTDTYNKCTADKLDFTEQCGARVPVAHRLLGLLYNDILHHKEQYDYISAIISKMRNPAVRSMIHEIPIP